MRRIFSAGKRKEKGLIILDEQTAIIDKIETTMDALRIPHKKPSRFHAENVIERAFYLSSAKSNFIQMADVCNFFINRFYTTRYKKAISSGRKEFFDEMWEKIHPLIVQPSFDPYADTDFSFFDDKAGEVAK